MPEWNIDGIAHEVIDQLIKDFLECKHPDLQTLHDDVVMEIIHDVCFPLETGREFTQRDEVRTRVAEIVDLIDRTVEAAANEGIRTIQNELGIESGDFAGYHFSDRAEFKAILAPLYRYMLAELKNKETPA